MKSPFECLVKVDNLKESSYGSLFIRRDGYAALRLKSPHRVFEFLVFDMPDGGQNSAGDRTTLTRCLKQRYRGPGNCKGPSFRASAAGVD